ncbi:MAG: hypothetical protein CMP34_02100 [Rickettsiales bacterium]|nr:hypothetical protein [Rickettsiales bacterium]|tara:strand:- start:2087 stop:2347 length:261 start_codon:yes stop_codon:yes gene_type:complete
MKTINTILFVISIVILVALNLIISNQEIKITKLEEQIEQINTEIEKITNNITYDTRPQRLKEINELEFDLEPILQEDRIKLNQKDF